MTPTAWTVVIVSFLAGMGASSFFYHFKMKQEIEYALESIQQVWEKNVVKIPAIYMHPIVDCRRIVEDIGRAFGIEPTSRNRILISNMQPRRTASGTGISAPSSAGCPLV
jgi:hypothetical protein